MRILFEFLYLLFLLYLIYVFGSIFLDIIKAIIWFFQTFGGLPFPYV